MMTVGGEGALKRGRESRREGERKRYEAEFVAPACVIL